MRRGFTLMEIMVVVVIVAALASLALPRFTSTVERVRASEGVQLLTALLGAQKVYQLENGNYANSLASLEVEILRADGFNVGSINVQNNPNNVASIQRTGAYTLRIDEDGNIFCAGGGTFTCTQAGY
jgi:prepilin-type N-terminal cleavage/methylation domain-containing protein